ncbi:hypothetical protein MNBD_CHLOROFLEXI01-2982 [hydrothermal vent metagenome]|uniref:Uncharacterized protein n=1 Tax=hydrothermal vent metagenome TaxID=652676 RepID=A0A3B0V441_9ZZZZ
MSDKTWRKPKSRSVGLFTDLRLFSEALEIASERGIVNRQILEEELPQRLQGLMFVERQSKRAANDLMRELRNFNWIWPVNGSKRPSDTANYTLLPDGEKAHKLSKAHKREFLRELTTQMQTLYTIPGWFVDRLWTINPSRQGEVVVPAPPPDWNPNSRRWEDKTWTSELQDQTVRTLILINGICPSSFPIKPDDWIQTVQQAWTRLSNLERKKVAKAPKGKEKGKVKTYAPRSRLNLAMKEAAVNFLFSSKPPYQNNNDFHMTRPPLHPRTYRSWCRRLEALELIFYTDTHPLVPGRLIFPTAIFRQVAPEERFERVGYIQNPGGQFLWLHRPKWHVIKDDFLNVLKQEYLRVSVRVGSLYVSIQDVRDEVCRQLRLSAATFDEFLEKILRDSLLPASQWSISVETDVREAQTASQLVRRPVWIGGTAHSLIAMTESRELSKIM